MPVPSHQTIRLSRGRHASPDDGACVMELASMLAGEPFSDQPVSVCPVIGAFLRTYNDGVDDERRQDLYPYAALVVGTRGGPELVRRRKRLCLERQADGGPVSWLRVAFIGAAAAGQGAARCFLGPDGARHEEALAFLDRLIGEQERTLDLELERALHGAGGDLARPKAP